MCLSAREQRTLDCIADELARSDPKLASILDVFDRLAVGEEMPERQVGCGMGQRQVRRSHPGRRCRLRNLYWARRASGRVWPVVPACILMGAMLIAAMLVLSFAGPGSGGRGRCVPPWSVVCAGR